MYFEVVWLLSLERRPYYHFRRDALIEGLVLGDELGGKRTHLFEIGGEDGYAFVDELLHWRLVVRDDADILARLKTLLTTLCENPT